VLGICPNPKLYMLHETEILNKTTKQGTQLQKEKTEEECGDRKEKPLLDPLLL